MICLQRKKILFLSTMDFIRGRTDDDQKAGLRIRIYLIRIRMFEQRNRKQSTVKRRHIFLMKACNWLGTHYRFYYLKISILNRSSTELYNLCT
jgi:hypothetical protein